MQAFERCKSVNRSSETNYQVGGKNYVAQRF